jgi:hypothetical protein
MNTTALLKASIDYERSKTDVMSLLNHKRQDLSLMIDVIDMERAATKHSIDSTRYLIETAEDMEEALEVTLRSNLAELQRKLDTLLAYRMLFLTAWNQVKQ